MQRRTFLLKTAGLATLSFTGIPSAWANDAADTPRVLYVLLRGEIGRASCKERV